jgi:dipeptidyl aminopeptidase/acylaminoacyl peptidase
MRLFVRMLVLVTSLGLSGIVAKAAPLSAYGKLPALDLVSLSPSGDKIAFVATDGDTRKLFVRKVGGDALLVDPVGDTKVRALDWAGDDFLLVDATATLKFGDGSLDKWSYSTRAELTRMLIVDLKTHTMKRMFATHEGDVFLDIVTHFYNNQKIDGKWYAFVRAFQNGEQVFKVDLDSGQFKLMTPRGGAEYGYAVEGGVIAAHNRYDEYTRSWNLYAGDTGTQAIVTRKSPLWTVGTEGEGRTPGTLVVTDVQDQKRTWDEYPLTPGAAPTPLFVGQDVVGLIKDPVDYRLLGGELEGDKGAVFFDPKLQHRYDAVRKAFPGLRTEVVSFSSGMDRIVAKTEGGDDSGTFWMVDMTTGKADELTAAYPAIGPADVGPTRMFGYKASDGVAMEGVLTLPPKSDGKNLPMVVMPHGGPFGFHDHVGFDWWAQAFASRGYAVFQPNYRGSGGYGVPFHDLGYGEWGRRMLTDMSDGVDALAQAGIVARNRVCIVGASYGGYAALAGVTTQPGGYRCAVADAPVSEVSSIVAEQGDNDGNAYGRKTRREFGVTSAGDPALREISPVWHPDKANAPILMLHGKDDTVVPYVHSLSMHEALDKHGKVNQLVPLVAEDHWLSHAATREQVVEASVAWVEKYNPVN